MKCNIKDFPSNVKVADLNIIDGPSTGEVRLYYSYYYPFYHRGRVEVYLGEEWGIVANDGSWTIEDGEVVCRELGFEISSEHNTITTKYACDIF